MRPGRLPAGLLCVAGLAAVAAAGTACTEREALVLLDLRTSGPLDAPVARVRLSAPGWQTRVFSAAIGPEGLRAGYYGPADGGAVSVTAEGLDGVNCVLGRGSATVPTLETGATSEATTLFIRPVPESGCTVVDAGGDPQDAGGDPQDAGGGGQDAAPDTGAMDTGSADTGGTDTPLDANGADAADAAVDVDASVD